MRARSVSEYSLESMSDFRETLEKPVDVKKDLKNRGILYARLLKSSCWVPLAIIPPAIVGGTSMIIFLLFGIIMNEHTKWNQNREYDALPKILTICLWLVGLGILSGVCKFLSMFAWIRIGSRFTLKLKDDLFTNMMRNDVGFFDMDSVGGLLTLLNEDAQLVQEAFGSTKSQQIGNLTQFLLSIILSYIYSWQLALVATAIVPIIAITISLFSLCIDRHIIRKFLYISSSMTIAEETLAAIRTVRGFNREKTEAGRFVDQIQRAKTEDHWVENLVNLLFTVVYTCACAMVAGNMYWGGKMVQQHRLNPGDVLSLFGYLLFGIFALIEFQGSVQAEQKAIASGGRILKLAGRTPDINFEGGEQIEDFKGLIEFRNVSFKYPSRDIYVLKNVSFTIQPGQIGALVGHSGSGKSTCVQLLERYYDVTEGVVLLDGHDIRTLDPRWLHRKTALVSQEPILFQMSVKDNIKYGRTDATDDEVEAAADVACAKKFIMKMEHGFDQMVGEKGSTLSGGQRQRIAIARAVIKDPVILITDEATSALDAKSEKKVQLALDQIMTNRTSVIVAHRLTTIRNAHVIYVFDAGVIVESGDHNSLLAKKGAYYELVRRQLSANELEEIETSSQSS